MCACSGGAGDPIDGDAGPDGGGETSYACIERSGSRLRRVVRENSDGSEQFLRLFDAEIGETCNFGKASDGSLRCIPFADGSPVTVGRVVFSDVQCQIRVAELAVQPGPVAPRILQDLRNPDGCGLIATHHALGERVSVTPGTTQLFSLDGEACNAFAALPNAYFQITGDVPPEDLVLGTESFTSSGRLEVRQIDGDDDSRLCDAFGNFRDNERDRACILSQDRDGELRCMPFMHGPQTLYTDADCMTEVKVVITAPGSSTCDGAEEIEYAIDTVEGCGFRGAVRTLGEPITVPLFERIGEACQMRVVQNAELRRGLGTEVDPTQFPLVERDWAGGDTRLQRGDLIVPGGFRVFRGRWRDSELGDAHCQFIDATDRTLRCLPSALADSPQARVVAAFRDEACSQQLRLAQVEPFLCADGEPSFGLEGTSQGTRVFELGEVDPGPIYRMTPTCTAVEDVGTYRALGAEVAPARFVGGTETIE